MRESISMKIVIGISVFLTLLITGCASNHYAEVHEGSIALYYQNKDAEEVFFASSIDRFQLHQAVKLASGVWEVIVPLKEEFTYFYLVDKHLTIPECQYKIMDDFGSQNCVFVSGL